MVKGEHMAKIKLIIGWAKSYKTWELMDYVAAVGIVVGAIVILNIIF
tara:strand:- start:400 stop:540 length:141 start_codon:yes stop_codon:yes gene_type:complete